MKITRNLLTAFACALTMATGLKGDEQPESPTIRFGLGAGLVQPLSNDLKDVVGSGGSFALFLEVLWPNRMGIRAVTEGISFAEKQIQYGYSTVNRGAEAFEVRAEYISRFVSPDEGLFFFTGLGYLKATSKANMGGYSISEEASGASYTIGLGYDFGRRFGIEARYAQVKLVFPSSIKTENHTTLNFGVRVRF
jgi:hypothetical protein